MGVGAAQEIDVEHPRLFGIVDKQRPAGEQAAVFVARNRGPEVAGGHRIPFICRAANISELP
jgi:hypothetical protein